MRGIRLLSVGILAALVIVGAMPATAPAASPVPEARTIRNWHAFTRLYGYVRWFCPSDEAAATDWDGLAILGPRRVRDLPDDVALRRALVELFTPIAPSLLIFEPAKTPPIEPIAAPADSRRLSWQHVGVGAGATTRYPGYRSLRTVDSVGAARLFDELPGRDETYEHDLVTGLRCRVPISLPNVGGHTQPEADLFALGRLRAEIDVARGTRVTADDEAVRVASIVVLWNVTQHFWPYFDVVHPDWEGALDRVLARSLHDRTPKDYALTLGLMTSLLEDGHVNVRPPFTPPRAWTPLAFTWAEGRVVVEDSSDSLVRKGDVVRSIDGRDAKACLDSIMAIRSGTERWRRFRTLRVLGLGDSGSVARLELERDGKRVRVSIPRTEPAIVSPRRPDPVAEIEPGIWYVDLERSRMSQIDSVMTQLADAKGVVFDMRGYPNSTHPVLCHLIDTEIQSAIWRKPRTIRPDRPGAAGWDESGRWMMGPVQPRIHGRIAFLIGPGAISYAESVLGIVEHYRLGELVGESTAGTNGNINQFTLPGGTSVTWTGMRVMKHDGSEHMKVGIQPTTRVVPTIAGIRAGRDEVLDRGLAIVRGGEARP